MKDTQDREEPHPNCAFNSRPLKLQLVGGEECYEGRRRRRGRLLEGSVKKRWVGRGIETSEREGERERDSEKSRVAKKRIGEPPCRGPFRGRLGVMSTGLPCLT